MGVELRRLDQIMGLDILLIHLLSSCEAVGYDEVVKDLK